MSKTKFVLDLQKDAPFIRTPYNYDTASVSDATGLSCPEPTKTQQQFKDDADINILLERFGAGQNIPLATRAPIWGMDFTEDFDFQRAFDAVQAAMQGFDDLPAKIKNRFDNNPGKLLKFLEDPDNRDEAIALQIIPKPDPVPEKPGPMPTSVTVVEPVQGATPSPLTPSPAAPGGRKAGT